MSRSVRVLIVDDSEDDALLLVTELEDSGFRLDWLRVDTPEAMKSALQSGGWDIVIADYRMPRFSGPAALSVLLESRQDIPFILVSGTAAENTGVEMMREGARDFIIKHSLSRLGPAVDRELREAEVRKQRRHAEDVARVSAENYRMIFEHSPVAIIAYDHDGVILQVNPAFEQLYGFRAEEVVGRRVSETFGRHRQSGKARDMLKRIFAGEVIRNAEWEDVRADGTRIFVLANVTPVYDEHGGIAMSLSMVTDITERKLAEEREREREAQQREFYRRTVLAATDGKLLIADRAEIDELACSLLCSWSIRSKFDLATVREDVNRIAREQGMEETRVPFFMGCIVEATANAIKHAGGGEAGLCRRDDSLIYKVSDSGPGIHAMALPDVALVKGYSTSGTLGMGYKIMIQSADRIYLATGPDGTTVAVEMGLRGAPATSGNYLLQRFPPE